MLSCFFHHSLFITSEGFSFDAFHILYHIHDIISTDNKTKID